MLQDASLSPFDGCVSQDELDVYASDGRVLRGFYLVQAGMHFLHVRDGSPLGKVEGPFSADAVASVVRVRTRDEVVAARFERSRGEPVPGVLRRTREGYEARLDTLARAAAGAPDWKRRMEIENQFDDVADEIALARTKRNWLLAVARWSRARNEAPTKLDLCGGDLTSAERLQRPRPQDFDPDLKVRRAAVRVPPHIAADPKSPPNMIRALRAAGFTVRRSIIGETDFDQAALLVDFPGGKERGRFSVVGVRDSDGAMGWRCFWDIKSSRIDAVRHTRALRSPHYARLVEVLAEGLVPAPYVACRPVRSSVSETRGLR